MASSRVMADSRRPPQSFQTAQHQPKRRSRPRPALGPVSLAWSLAAIALFLPIPAQASASTSPVEPTAVLVHGQDAVEPELAAGTSGSALGRVRRSPQNEVEPTTTSRRARASADPEASTAVDEPSADGTSSAARAAQTVISNVPDDPSTVATTSLAVAASASSTTNPPSSTTSALISTSTAVPEGYQLPQAFDSTLGTNFTSTSCPSFFATFLADPSFQACAPFSLLLTTSKAFFQAERSPYGLLPHVLDASCSAPSADCSALMSSYARQIQLKNTCAQDLERGNPLAVEALEGFQSYDLMREAGCLRNNETEAYCFADASANPDPSNLYFYYLPEGTTLPSGTTPDCDACTQNLLGIYARYATNSTLAISRTYASGRSATALVCGPDFAPAVAAASTVSSVAPPSAHRHPAAWLGIAAATALLGVCAA